MLKQKLIYYFQQLFTPVLMVVLGLTLIFSPDSASAFVAQVLGWLVLAAGATLVISGAKSKTLSTVLYGAACLLIGLWLIRNPLILAKSIGRLSGLVLLVRGIGDILESSQEKRELVIPILTAGLGAVLLLLPMTTSRVVMILFGLVLLLLGGATLAARIRLILAKRLPDSDGGGQVIDVDPL